jgi:glyoxylase-like metal-dependent hydrolase (beta-lactamase superfamily II)
MLSPGTFFIDRSRCFVITYKLKHYEIEESCSMEVLKIKGNTYCIDTGMTYIPFYKINDEEIIMLDSGWARGEREGIVSLLEGNNFRVAAIINSHCHIDHVGNNAFLKTKYNSIIAMPAYEAYVCSSAVNLKVYYGSMTLTEVEQQIGHMVCETDIKITEEQSKIFVCDIKFKIVHTPGHSPAHICIITPDDVAYMGDSLISHDVMNGAKMPYAYILREDLKSKEKLFGLSCSKYVVAHKGIYDDITRLVYDNITFYKHRAQLVYDAIEDAMTMEEMFRAAKKCFGICVTNRPRFLVLERMFRSYLEYLHETGMVKSILDDGFIKYIKTENGGTGL